MNKEHFLGICPELTEYSISSQKVPKGFDGFRIAHISDTHSYPSPKIFELVKSANPDIICITGDMFHDDDKNTDNFFALFDKLTSLASVYLVTGNHDVWRKDVNACLRKIEEHGGILIDEKMEIVRKDGDELALFGIGDPFSKIPHVIEENINSAYLKLPKFDGYKILLFHRANMFDKICDLGFDLILSGHMHGGQFRLPLLGGTLAPSSSILSGRMIFPKYTSGKYEYKDTAMVVNRGASNTLPVPRILNPPEVGIITLFNKK